LNEGKVVGSEPVVARRHPTTLFDPVEEPLDLVASGMEIGAEADRIAAIALRGTFAHEPFFMASSLIQSASYPRSASNIDPDFKRDSSFPASLTS